MSSQKEVASAAGGVHVITMKGPSLLDKMSRKLTISSEQKIFTIFRAPSNIREGKKYLFEPSVVSIGPYHRGSSHLKAMEAKKWHFLQSLLDHGKCSLEICITKIKALEKQARDCYNEPFDLNSDEFVEMMVLDGCFIVEFFYKYFRNACDKDINEGWISLIIENDLILLENQIPFFIITALQDFLPGRLDFAKIARTLARSKIPIETPTRSETIHHLLHLCHSYSVQEQPSDARQNVASEHNLSHFINCISTDNISKEEMKDERIWMTIPCATELEEAGIKFKKAKKSNDLTRITFNSGTLVIPRLQIDDSVKPLFMNLLALEQCMSLQLPCHFSTYLMFMDKLVNTPHDVQILQNEGILDNMLSSKEEVAHFFNQTNQSAQIPKNHYLVDVFEKLNRYCQSRYNKYRARFCHDYCNSPWTIISVIAAIVLLLLTIAQTFMAVYSYIRPPS